MHWVSECVTKNNVHMFHIYVCGEEKIINKRGERKQNWSEKELVNVYTVKPWWYIPIIYVFQSYYICLILRHVLSKYCFPMVYNLMWPYLLSSAPPSPHTLSLFFFFGYKVRLLSRMSFNQINLCWNICISDLKWCCLNFFFICTIIF
jgi:hypothetical protein